MLALLLLLPASVIAGDSYKCTGKDGVTAYVNNHMEDYESCEKIAGLETSQPEPASAQRGSWQYRQSRADESPPQAVAAANRAPKRTRVVRGSVYKRTDDSGVTYYTNIKSQARGSTLLFHYIATCTACDVHSTIDWHSVPLNLTAYRDQVAAAAAEFGVDPALLRALIHAESAFDANALSAKGAQGLTQLMPATAADMGVSNAFDATQNIRGGAKYLAFLLKEFDGNERLATAAYNAGPGAVQKYDGVPPYAETQVYVDRVEILRDRYRDAGGGGGAVAAASP